jgi:hypothetical protein
VDKSSAILTCCSPLLRVRSRTRARGLLDPGEAAVHERLLGSQAGVAALAHSPRTELS